MINRLLTEIAGARFVDKLAGGGNKRPTTRDASDGSALDVNELLQPKKKARKASAPKRRAAPKGAAASAARVPTESKDDIEADVEMSVNGQASDDATAHSRARWWVDDLLSCLVHAAGGATTTSDAEYMSCIAAACLCVLFENCHRHGCHGSA